MTPFEILESARLAELRREHNAASCPVAPPPFRRDPVFRLLAWVVRGVIGLFFRLLFAAMPRQSENPAGEQEEA